MNYDDDIFERRPRKQGFSGLTVIVIALIASLVGGGTMAMLTPSMIQAGIIDISQIPNTSTEQQSNHSLSQKQIVNQKVQLEVTSAIVDAVERIKPAVVGIVNIQSGRRGFFSNYYEEYEAGSGSGVVIDVTGDKALVVTNHHVIEGASAIAVTLPDGEQVDARLVGSDILTDLAVVEIDASHVTAVASFGDSDVLRPGEPAIAIGNPLGIEFAQTVTVGVISGTQRSLPVNIGGDKIYEINVLQTDAAINFGNSGGALVNINGELIGINSAKIAREGVEGIGFAIPMNDAEPIINDLIAHGRVIRPFLGITPRDLNTIPEQWRPMTPVKEGVILADNPMGPAAQAGMKMYDIIVEIDGQPVDNVVTLRKILYNKKVGDTVNIGFYRGTERMNTKIVLTELADVQ